VHTAVKIDPAYDGAVVYVPDASRAVGVVQRLLSDTRRETYIQEIKDEYARIRASRRDRAAKGRLLPLNEARARRLRIDWGAAPAPRPKRLGVHVLDDYPLDDLLPRIDWTPFFQAWEMPGRFPQILEDADKGREARRLHADAQAMLEQIVEHGLLTAKGVFGLFPAASVDDDIEVYADESREHLRCVIHTLRQQQAKGGNQPNLALADFIAPKSAGVPDYIGAFAVTAGHGLEALVARFERDHDDYRAILAKTLADRLAEAFAERLHERVRREFWGYAADEDLDNEALIREQYQGIRPAPGYPACPDHTEKRTLFALLDAPRAAGMRLTENDAMQPAASVSGYYFWRPESRYFGVTRIGRDQVADYARRKGASVAEVERWLAPILAYDP